MISVFLLFLLLSMLVIAFIAGVHSIIMWHRYERMIRACEKKLQGSTALTHDVDHPSPLHRQVGPTACEIITKDERL